MNSQSTPSSIECHASSGDMQEALSHETKCLFEESDPTSTIEGDACSGDIEDQEFEDMSAWKYARHHGLCRDYFAENPISSLSEFPLLNSDTSSIDDITNHPIVQVEKLFIEKEAASILKSVICPPQYEEQTLPTPSKRIKLELPLLKYDHEVDMFRVLKRPSFDLDSMVLHLQPGNPENDDDLDWSSSMLAVPNREEQKIWKEKLMVPKETLIYLKELHDYGGTSDSEVEETNDFTYIKKLNLRPFTPPLSTAAADFSSMLRESPDITLQLMSEGPDPDVKILQEIETQMAKADAIKPSHLSGEVNSDELDISVIDPELHSMIQSSSPYAPKASLNNCRIEGPLSPPAEPQDKKIFQMTTLAEELGNEASKLLKWELSNENQQSESETDAMNMLRPLAEKAFNTINQEVLTEAGAITRVEVPIMHFPPVMAPWNVYGQLNGGDENFVYDLKAQQRLLQEVSEGLKSFSSWSGISKLELNLPWRPFPNKLAEIALDEKIDKLDYLSGILEYMTLEDVGTSESLAWKQQGLRILDDSGEDDGDLALGIFPEEERGVEFLVRKRKLEQIPDQVGMQDNSWQISAIPKEISVFEQPNLNSSPPQKRQRAGQEPSKSFTPFSTKEAVDMFLRLNGIQPRSVTDTLSVNDTVTNINQSRDPRKRQLPKEVSEPEHQSTEEIKEHHECLSVELPHLPSTLPKRFAIVTSEMLQNRRSLYRRITNSYSNCEFVERDFSIIKPLEKLGDLTSTTQRTSHFDPCAEADLVISPSTGILLITVQKIQQRSLPGQGTQQNTFNTRLSQVSARYEKLIVLVSQGVVEEEQPTTFTNSTTAMLPPPPPSRLHTTTRPTLPPSSTTTASSSSTTATTPVTTRETNALASLQSLAATLKANVYVQFVLGGERNLAAWTGFHIYASGTAMLHVQPEESQWEHVLRRAGLNCFAAGVVLTVLKRSEHNTEEQEESSGCVVAARPADAEYGLAAFLSMDPEERFLWFEKLLGGRKVLKRVNACLERGWISESTGFKSVKTGLHHHGKL